MSAFATLTSDDLLKISEIVDKSIKDSETRIKEYIDIKFETVDERFKRVDEQFKNVDERFESINSRFDDFGKGIDSRFDDLGGKINILTAVVCALIGLIGVVIALPAWRESKANRALEKQVEILAQKIETLENGHIQTP